jgi:hypothetical protein
MPRISRSSSTLFGGDDGDGSGPDEVLEFAAQAVEYVRRALGVTLEYDSDTLPVLDHYLREVGVPHGPARTGADADRPEAVAADLVAATSGAYFGEVVRRRLGGSWSMPSRDPGSWRLVLPSGLWFFPAAMAMAAIVGPDADVDDGPDLDRDPDADDDDDDDDDDRADLDAEKSVDEWDPSLQAPPLLREQVRRVLHGMADVSEQEYYSLCCRLDTLEHVQSVLAATASAGRSHRDPDTLD